MLLIVLGHFIWHGFKQTPLTSEFPLTPIGGMNYVTMELLWIICCIGVDSFVLITGYFMIDRSEMRWGGAIKTLALTLFYSLGFLALFALAGGDIQRGELTKSLFPIHEEHYWFVTHYMGLLFLAPFFAKVAMVLDKRQYQWLLAVLLVMSSVYLYGTVYLRNMHLGFFVFCFFVGGYIRKFSVPVWWKRHAGWVVMAVWIALFVLGTCVNVLTVLKNGTCVFHLLSTENNGLVFFLALSVFVWFITRNGKSMLLIRLSKLAPYTFGVYLIHENVFVKQHVWSYAMDHYDATVLMLPQCLLWGIGVFCCCACLDFVRSTLFSWTGIDKMIRSIGSNHKNIV